MIAEVVAILEREAEPPELIWCIDIGLGCWAATAGRSGVVRYAVYNGDGGASLILGFAYPVTLTQGDTLNITADFKL